MKLVIYHGNCFDGFTAAYACWVNFAENAEFHPGVYGQEPPNVTDREVLMVDFSYKRPVLVEMAKKAKSIVILDHHKSAEADLKDIEQECKNIKCTFDMFKSGAVLTWHHLFPGCPLPKLFSYIQDRDLWQWKLPHSDYINAYIKLLDQDFRVWDKLRHDLEDLHHFNQICAAGKVAIQSTQHYVKTLAKTAAREIEFEGYKVLAINAPYYNISDLLNELCKDRPFAIAYFQRQDGQWQYSLRSDANGIDVSKIAEKLGGGGHRNASGAQTKELVI